MGAYLKECGSPLDVMMSYLILNFHGPEFF